MNPMVLTALWTGAVAGCGMFFFLLIFSSDDLLFLAHGFVFIYTGLLLGIFEGLSFEDQWGYWGIWSASALGTAFLMGTGWSLVRIAKSRLHRSNTKGDQ